MHKLHLRVLPAIFLLILLRDAGAERPNSVYVEILGKGGLWGLGYDRVLGARFAAGVTASFYVLDGEQITSFNPYLALSLLGTGHHRWFLHGGPQLVRVAVPSPVPEWSGTSRMGVAAEVSSGYEYRDHLLFRIFVMGTAGKGRAAPWIGASLGWTL